MQFAPVEDAISNPNPQDLVIGPQELVTAAAYCDAAAEALRGAPSSTASLPLSHFAVASANITKGQHMAHECRTMLFTEVFDSVRQATQSPSFSNFKKAKQAVEDGQKCAADMVPSLHVAVDLLTNATNSVVAWDKISGPSRGDIWRKVLAFGSWVNSVVFGRTPDRGLLQAEYERAEARSKKVSDATDLMSLSKDLVEGELEHFEGLEKDLRFLAYQYGSIISFGQSPNPDVPNDAPTFVQGLGSLRHAAVLEQMFRNALEANVGDAKLSRQMEEALGTAPALNG